MSSGPRLSRPVSIKITISLLLFVAFCHTAAAQATATNWQVKAIEKYPALGIRGSELNIRFLDAYSARRKTDPAFFDNPQWPLVLADELAAPISIKAVQPSPPQVDEEQAAKVPERREQAKVEATPRATTVRNVAKIEPTPPATRFALPNLSDTASFLGTVVIGIVALGVVLALCWIATHWKVLSDICDVVQLIWKLFFG